MRLEIIAKAEYIGCLSPLESCWNNVRRVGTDLDLGSCEFYRPSGTCKLSLHADLSTGGPQVTIFVKAVWPRKGCWGTNAQNETEESEVYQNQRPRTLPNSSNMSLPWATAEDLRFITVTFQHLHTSGWYWGGMTASEARDALIGASEGTFLVRDSSHPLYLFTLSVKTCRGPTNVRIEYDSGHFRLDSSFTARSCLLSFPAIPNLLQHYVTASQSEEDKSIAKEHQVVSKDNAVLLKLRKPLHRPQAFPTLQHLTRLAINRHSDCHAQLPLPRPLLLYLQEYPFQV